MIYLGSDHGGFFLKQAIKKYLSEKGYYYKDMGNLEFDKKDDYPVYAFKVAEAVASEKGSKGILLCRSSGGMVIAANKVKGIRAVSAFDAKEARHARQHNNANIIALPGDWLTEKAALEIVEAFLEEAFSGEERHKRRLGLIKDYENKVYKKTRFTNKVNK